MAKEYKQNPFPVGKAELLMTGSQELQFTWSRRVW